MAAENYGMHPFDDLITSLAVKEDGFLISLVFGQCLRLTHKEPSGLLFKCVRALLYHPLGLSAGICIGTAIMWISVGF